MVVLTPLGLAHITGLPPRPWRDELATGLGLLAFAMILAEFVLSGRFRSVSGGTGLDATIRFHQLMARVALGATLLHPFLYVTPGAASLPWDASRQLTLTWDIGALATGIAAYLLLPAFILMAIAHRHLPYRYEAWRLMHGLGALLIAGLLLHHSLSAGRYSSEPLLVWYWVAMMAVATLSLLVVYILKPLAQLRRPWRVSAVEPLTDRQWRVRIAPVGHDGISYEAGQFVWLNIGHSPFSLQENPFSISSAPASGPELEFMIKEFGDFTSRIGEVAIGTPAHIDGPHGTLTITRHKAEGIALIAGGVGLAPLLGILRQMRTDGDPRPVTLIYGNRNADQIAFASELERLDACPKTQVIHLLTEPSEGWTGATGLIDAALIDRTFDARQLAGWLFVICGPPPMMTAVEHLLMARGVPSSRILSERFQYD